MADRPVPTSRTAEEFFADLSVEQLTRPGVSGGRIWHNEGLTANGKIFAMLVRGRLVVKLPATRAAGLIVAGDGVAFEPRPGRPMRQWVVVEPPADPADETGWRQLIDDAGRYVAGL